MQDQDRLLRNHTYRLFVDLGRPPTIAETAGTLGRSEQDVAAGWRRLHDGHALVLQDDVDEIRMANPFSGVPTAYRVQAAGSWWYANCAWDAFGIPAALDVDGRIESSCPDCGALLSVTVEGGHVSDRELLFHCLVPATAWWDDIVFT